MTLAELYELIATMRCRCVEEDCKCLSGSASRTSYRQMTAMCLCMQSGGFELRGDDGGR